MAFRITDQQDNLSYLEGSGCECPQSAISTMRLTQPDRTLTIRLLILVQSPSNRATTRAASSNSGRRRLRVRVSLDAHALAAW